MSELVSESVTRSPIELFWPAKNRWKTWRWPTARVGSSSEVEATFQSRWDYSLNLQTFCTQTFSPKRDSSLNIPRIFYHCQSFKFRPKSGATLQTARSISFCTGGQLPSMNPLAEFPSSTPSSQASRWKVDLSRKSMVAVGPTYK